MTEVDTSIYNKTASKPFDPLETIGKYQGVANSMMQNRLMQQEQQSNQMMLNAKNSLIQADRESRNPDGTRNIAAYNNALSGGPGALLSTEENIRNLQLAQPTTYNAEENGVYRPNTVQAQQMSGVLSPDDVAAAEAQRIYENLTPEQVQKLQMQADKLHDKTDSIIDELTPIANNPNVTNKEILDAAGNIVSNGHISAQEAAAHISSLPADESQIPAWANEKLHNSKVTKNLLNIVSPKIHKGNDTSNLPSVNNPPVGYSSPLVASRDTYNQVKTMAESAPDKLAAFNEVVNLNDAGAKTGTSVSDMYQKLAKTGLVPQGINDTAAQTQLIGKYIHRTYADSLPNSDHRADILESSQITPGQLSETIHELVPFMKASTQGLVAKQKFYNEQTKNGSNLIGEPMLSQKWNQNYDPRWIEFDSLDKKDKRAFLVKHPDMINKKHNYQVLQTMGIVGEQ